MGKNVKKTTRKFKMAIRKQIMQRIHLFSGFSSLKAV